MLLCERSWLSAHCDAHLCICALLFIPEWAGIEILSVFQENLCGMSKEGSTEDFKPSSETSVPIRICVQNKVCRCDGRLADEESLYKDDREKFSSSSLEEARAPCSSPQIVSGRHNGVHQWDVVI